MVEICFHDVHPAVYLWHVLGAGITGLLIYLSWGDAVVPFYFLFMSFNFAGIFAYVFGWFSDLTHNSDDWNHGEDDPKQIGIWTGVGLAALMGVSVIVSLYINEVFSIIWVPMDLTPLSLSSGVMLSFVFSLGATWFAVVPGEEGLKTLLSGTIFKGLESVLPGTPWFVMHPARLLANCAWAGLHVILGQNPWPFFLSVLIGGMLWDFVSARCGTILVSYFIHGLFNSLILIVTFITAIGLTLIW